MRFLSVIRPAALAAVVLLATPQGAWAANYPLELTNIGPAGVNGMSASNRIFRAYPGLTYNIRAAVVGGAYPFTFSLSNAPSGMTIDARTGEINWVNPQATATPTIRVEDSEGAGVSATWTINVTTNGFRFVDAVRGAGAANNGCSSNCGTGTLQNPWRTLGDLALNDGPSDITYFRSGAYYAEQVPASMRQSVGSVWERVVFSDNAASSAAGSVMWVAYPGETPVIDLTCGSCAQGLLIRHSGQNVYMDGLEVRNPRIIAFQFEPTSAWRGGTYRRLRMHDLSPGGDGTNAAFIMSVSTYPAVSYGMVIQDSAFWNVTRGSVTIKVYSQSKLLVENTTQFNADVALELKADVRQFSVRGNRFYNITGTAIGGNMHGCPCGGAADTATTRGEIIFNLAQSAGMALDLNQDGQALEVYTSRNTFIGRVQLRNTDTSDGPFYFYRNVIVSNDSGTPAGSHIYHSNVTAPLRQVVLENLVGYPSDNIIDASGNLTPAYGSYLGTRGYEGSGSAVFNLPTVPRNLRITP